MRTGVTCAILLAGGLLVLGLSGCGGKRKIISVDGSSTVFPVTEAVAEEFQIQNRGKVRVTVGISGTGGGFKKFVRGEIDVQDASRPILKEEIEDAKKNGIEFIELPICFDALSIAVSSKNDFITEIDVDELKKIWEPGGKVKKWNQVRKEWPDREFKLYGAGTDSGTFDYFTEAIVGKRASSRTDYTASEDDNTLVQGIAGDPYALGYIPYSYLATNTDKLKAVKVSWIKKKIKEPVEPSKDTILDGTYTPLSRPLFLYVSKKSLDSKPEVKEFVQFFLDNVARLSNKVKYVQLSDEAYELIQKRFKDGKTGTSFGGEAQIGLSIADIMKLEPK